jgi:hypothetical protein
MKTVDGVVFIKKEGYAVCHIQNFSDAFKELIRKQLSFICYGASNAASSRRTYSYCNTIKEFIKRYHEKSEETKKGMIGELLIHILLNEFFTDYETVSPFFNLEERSVKKGFDVVLTYKKDKTMWITEVKSEELHQNKNANRTTITLLDTAKLDLFNRLNDIENQSLWLNAVNGAKIAFDSNNDLKDAVINILEQYADDSQDGKVNSVDINVFLTSALFCCLKDSIEENAIGEKYSRIKNENKFKDIFVISMQKETYKRVFEFLKNEEQ